MQEGNVFTVFKEGYTSGVLWSSLEYSKTMENHFNTFRKGQEVIDKK
jgi:hypothetical protein